MKSFFRPTTSVARAHRAATTAHITLAPLKQLLRCDGRVAAVAFRAAGKRRAAMRATITRASFTPQGPFMSGPGAGVPGPRRAVRRPPRDLQQLVDFLSGGAADDPEEFLQLLSAAPRILERRRVPLQQQQPAEPRDAAIAAATAAEQYARQLQQQQLLQQRQAVAAAEAWRRGQQQQQAEEEQRREALRAAMLQNARRHLPQYDAPSLARLASGLAAAGVRDPALCEEMMRQMVEAQRARQQQQLSQAQAQQQQQRQQQQVSEPRSLAELLDAFAAMRHRPSDDQLTELLLLQQQEQQRQQQLERWRQAQQQQALRAQPRLQPRGMMPASLAAAEPEAPPRPQAATSGGGSRTGNSTPPEDAARLLYALSRLGYSPDEGTLTQLLEQLQPQRLQLQPAELQPAAVAVQSLQLGPQSLASAPSPAQAGRAVPIEWETQQQQKVEADGAFAAAAAGARAVTGDGGNTDLEAHFSYSLQRDAQAVASAVRALERMGRPDKAQQLREHFMQHVREVQARVEREAREREEAQQRQQQEAAASAERERQAAAAAVDRGREWRQRLEDQAGALRQQLARKLRSADQWQQIRALLFTYPEALDAECLAAAAARLAELLSAARRGAGRGRGGGLSLRERGEVGDLLEGLGQLVVARLDGASAAQATSLLQSVVRMRHLEEGLLVALLRRLRDTLVGAGAGHVAAVVRALAECGVRPSKHWMETFLARCEELLERFSPEELSDLPVALAQLGAHPGRSWLGSYLDVLQAREAELSQAEVSDAVRAVALLDRPFLSAWRQAAAVRQQAQQQARAAAATAAAAAAVAQEQRRQQQEQQQQQAQRRQPADALASVDELLAGPSVRQDERDVEDAIQKDMLPPMHPKQRDMAAQQPQVSALASAAAAAGAGTQDRQAAQSSQPSQPQQLSAPQTHRSVDPSRAASSAGLNRPVQPMQSIELEIDAAVDLPYASGGDASAAATSTGVSLPSSEPAPAFAPAAAVRLAGAGATAASAPSTGRQLPGSFSMDGFYNPEPYGEYDDEYDDQWDGDVLGEGDSIGAEEEGEAWPQAAADKSASTTSTMARNTAGAAARAAAAPESPERVAAATPAASPHVAEGPATATAASIGEPLAGEVPAATAESAGAGPTPPAAQAEADGDAQRAAEAVPEPHQPPKPQLTPEELAQARALRSLLLERTEAVEVYQQEVDERRRRAAEAGGQEREFSEREVAAAGRLLAAREQLQRLQADFDNFRRRASEEREQALARARADTLRPLLSVADSFERAAAQIRPKTDGERAIHEAYQAVYGELQQLLKKEGLQELGVEGEAFDPTQHEAVMREDRDDVDDGTVTGVLQKGYRLGDVLVRPALVKVAFN